jgi:hypothetical protein
MVLEEIFLEKMKSLEIFSKTLESIGSEYVNVKNGMLKFIKL